MFTSPSSFEHETVALSDSLLTGQLAGALVTGGPGGPLQSPRGAPCLLGLLAYSQPREDTWPVLPGPAGWLRQCCVGSGRSGGGS